MFIEKSSAFTDAEKIVLGAVFAEKGLRTPRGMIAGTMVETSQGWLPVERVQMGMSVYTYDGGKKPVVAIERQTLGAELGTVYPDGLLLVPGGARDNCNAFYLLPEQHVMIESDIAADVLGAPAHLVPAAALEGFRGIQRVMPVDQIEIITLLFDEEEVVFANTGALIHCPKVAGDAERSDFAALTEDQARALLELMAMDAPWSDAEMPCAT